MKFVIPNADGKEYGFRKGEKYKVIEELPNNCYVVSNPLHENIIVRVGKPSMRLGLTDGGEYGEFELIDIPFEDDVVSYPLTTAASAMADATAERAANLARQIRVGKAFIGDAIITSGALKPSGEDWVKRCERLQDQVNELIAVNEEVRKILRCPDGFDVRKQAQVVRTLADTLIDITK